MDMKRKMTMQFGVTLAEGKLSEVRARAVFKAATEAVAKAITETLPAGMVADIAPQLSYGYDAFSASFSQQEMEAIMADGAVVAVP
jgi:hypothetical protein